MAIQITSLRAYNSIVKKLSTRQSSVLDCLRKMGRATNHQVAKTLDWEINRVTPRVLELRKKGLLRISGTRLESTGRRALLWEPVYPEELF